jgi:hypothetical protein
MYLVALILIALVTQSACIAPLRPADIQRQIAIDGPANELRFLFRDNRRWDRFLDAVATGEAPWLGVAAELRSRSDAAASETLDMAIQEALPKNPTRVLQLVSRGSFTSEGACGMYGFGQIEDERPLAVLLGLVDKRMAAVNDVHVPELAAVRDDCLRELRSLRQNLQKAR